MIDMEYRELVKQVLGRVAMHLSADAKSISDNLFNAGEFELALELALEETEDVINVLDKKLLSEIKNHTHISDYAGKEILSHLSK